MIYYPDPQDELWNREVEKVLGYLQRYGADIGCGRRSPFPHLLTVDLGHPEAQISAPADALPFDNNTLDFVYAGHVLEHTENPLGTVREWLRVVKPLGYVVIIHPDRRGTPWRGTMAFDSQHKGDYTWEELWELLSILPASLVNHDKMALQLQDGRPWSFKLILRKHGGVQ